MFLYVFLHVSTASDSIYSQPSCDCMAPQCHLQPAAWGINFHNDFNKELSWQENNYDYTFFISLSCPLLRNVKIKSFRLGSCL